MLASGELPDIIMGFRTFNDSDIMNNMEMFQPLDDLIDQYICQIIKKHWKRYRN